MNHIVNRLRGDAPHGEHSMKNDLDRRHAHASETTVAEEIDRTVDEIRTGEIARDEEQKQLLGRLP